MLRTLEELALELREMATRSHVQAFGADSAKLSALADEVMKLEEHLGAQAMLFAEASVETTVRVMMPPEAVIEYIQIRRSLDDFLDPCDDELALWVAHMEDYRRLLHQKAWGRLPSAAQEAINKIDPKTAEQFIRAAGLEPGDIKFAKLDPEPVEG